MNVEICGVNIELTSEQVAAIKCVKEERYITVFEFILTRGEMIKQDLAQEFVMATSNSYRPATMLGRYITKLCKSKKARSGENLYLESDLECSFNKCLSMVIRDLVDFKEIQETLNSNDYSTIRDFINESSDNEIKLLSTLYLSEHEKLSGVGRCLNNRYKVKSQSNYLSNKTDKSYLKSDLEKHLADTFRFLIKETMGIVV